MFRFSRFSVRQTCLLHPYLQRDVRVRNGTAEASRFLTTIGKNRILSTKRYRAIDMRRRQNLRILTVI